MPLKLFFDALVKRRLHVCYMRHTHTPKLLETWDAVFALTDSRTHRHMTDDLQVYLFQIPPSTALRPPACEFLTGCNWSLPDRRIDHSTGFRIHCLLFVCCAIFCSINHCRPFEIFILLALFTYVNYLAKCRLDLKFTIGLSLLLQELLPQYSCKSQLKHLLHVRKN